MAQKPKRALVIGGGITGLAASYRLTREAEKRGIPLDVTLLEASDRIGGVIRTTHRDGFVIEHGPDAFISTKPWAKALCEELGITDECIGTNSAMRRSFVVQKRKLHPVPEGFYMMAPGALLPFLKSPIFSWRGKLRMGLEPLMPRSGGTADESVADFVRRRLGTEAFERMAQPMIGGIYTSDAEHLSLKATFPRFLEMERAHGSIIKALLAQKRQAKAASGTSGPRYSLFLSFASGMQTLVDKLQQAHLTVAREPVPHESQQPHLTVARGPVPRESQQPHPTVARGPVPREHSPKAYLHLNTRAETLQQRKSGTGWQVSLANGEILEAELLCVALPAPQAGTLCENVSPALAKKLQAIPYASSATVNFAFRREAVAHPLNGMGFVVPAAERLSLIGCSFSSVKFENRAPAAHVLLRAFVRKEQESSESSLTAAALRDIAHLLGIKKEPIFSLVSQHTQAMAQYLVGHQERISEIETLANRLPGFALAGNAYHGIGIPDCIHSGEQAALALLDEEN